MLQNCCIAEYRCVPKIVSPEVRQQKLVEMLYSRVSLCTQNRLAGGAKKYVKTLQRRYRCVPKIASPENDDFFYSCAQQETGGPPGGEPGGERAAGFCDSQPAIPIVFADGSLRTHNQKLVGINEKLLFDKYRCVPKIDSPQIRNKISVSVQCKCLVYR